MVFLLFSGIIWMIGLIVFLQMVRQNAVLLKQREALADSLTEEHRARHNCLGPLFVQYDGYIRHARGEEADGRSS